MRVCRSRFFTSLSTTTTVPTHGTGARDANPFAIRKTLSLLDVLASDMVRDKWSGPDEMIYRIRARVFPMTKRKWREQLRERPPNSGEA